MEKRITKDNIASFAYICDNKLDPKEAKAICVDFMGLGLGAMFGAENAPEAAVTCSESGVLYIIPYLDPWNWMNKTAVETTDEIINAVFDKYGYKDDMPIVLSGHSMGGQCCLCYAAYAKRTPAGVAADSPVCDMPYHYTERADLPRTIYSAYYGSGRTVDEELEYRSPYHLALAQKLPKTAKYYDIHGEIDFLVNKKKHSDRFVEAMRKGGYDIIYDEVSDMNHCQLIGDRYDRFWSFVCGFAK